MKPNILWIMTDEQRADSLACYGSPFAQSPHIDALAARGARFERAYVQNPVCVPSRGSVLTGRYCRCLGMMQNGDSLPADAVTLTEVLNGHGYTTVNYGKIHLGSGPHGFSQHDTAGDRAGVSPYRAPEAPADGFPVKHVTDKMSPPVIISGTYPGAVEDHEAYQRVQKGIDFLKSAPSRPFLLRVSILSPHTPVLAPPPYDRMCDPADMPIEKITDAALASKPSPQRRFCEYYHVRDLSDEDLRVWKAHYYGLASFVDAQIGRLLAVLDETGLAENTIVALHADHGCMVGDKGLVTKGPFDYEQTNRVPFVMSYPKELPTGAVFRQFVEMVDFMPTILDLCGLEIPRTVQGRSLLPLMRGETEQHRDAVFSEGDGLNLDGTKERIREPRSTVRAERYKLVHFPRLEEGELYDLERDPMETENLFDDAGHAAVKQELLERLRIWRERYPGE